MKNAHSKALIDLQKAANAGNLKARIELARTLWRSASCQDDYRHSLVWFLSAAMQGDAESANFVGLAYYYGKGVTKNGETAAFWFKRAIAAGSIEALNNMGMCYATAEGASLNHGFALQLFRLAAEKGCEPASINANAIAQLTEQTQAAYNNSLNCNMASFAC